jgi:hypothetical protein
MSDYLSFFLVPSRSSNTPFIFKVVRAKECALIPYLSVAFILDSHLSLSRSLGARHIYCIFPCHARGFSNLKYASFLQFALHHFSYTFPYIEITKQHKDVTSLSGGKIHPFLNGRKL